MSRAKRDEPDTSPQTPEADTAPAETAPTTLQAETPAAPTSSPDEDLYEPYPGAAFFHGGRNSPIIRAMATRLAQEGHVPDGVTLGADWTNAHRRAFASFQHALRPKEGGDVSGIPDEVAWRQLHIPRVSPRTTPQES